MSCVDGKGIESWFGGWFYCGSQVYSNSSVFPWHEIGSAIVIYSPGTFDPPKVSLSDIRTYNVPFQLI